MTTQTASEKQRRVAIQIPSRYQALLLQRWADSTGRLKGSLALMLFEKGLEIAQIQGLIPQPIIDQLNNEFFTNP